MNIDKTIQDLFAKLDERKKKVAELRKETQKGWVTNCTWKIPFTATSINIQTLPEDQLNLVAGMINDYVITLGSGALLIGNSTSDTIQGYTLDQWKSDLKKRKATIEIRAEESKLDELNVRLNSVLSPEERRRIEVELLAKELG